MLKFKWETKFNQTEIGKIPKDWEVKKLQNVLDVKHGFAFPSKFFKKDGKIPVIKITNIREDNFIDLEDIEFLNPEEINKNIDRFYLKSGDMLIALTGATAGKIGILKGDYNKYLLNQRVGKFEITDRRSYLPFIFYCLVLDIYRELLLDLAEGSAQGNMSPSDIKNYVSIPYPFPKEQSRIASVFSWFDKLIENKKRQNEILEKAAIAIFKDWFIDFEPFKDGECLDSELGEIPEGWEVDYTTRIIEFNPKVSLKKAQIYPFVEMKQVSINSMVCEYNLKEFTGSGVRFQGGDTLLARITPSLENGKTAFIWFVDRDQASFGTTEFIVMRAKHNYLKEFVYLLARTEDFREHAINSMTGSTGRQRVEKEALEMFKIPIPPQPILEKFHSLVEPLFQKIITNQKQIMALRKTRDTLLPLLVFGKLRVVEL